MSLERLAREAGGRGRGGLVLWTEPGKGYYKDFCDYLARLLIALIKIHICSLALYSTSMW